MVKFKVYVGEEDLKEVNDLKHRENIVIQNFDNFKSEFKLIKNRFTQLSEFIKDLRFRKNVGKENLSKKEDVSKQSSSKEEAKGSIICPECKAEVKEGSKFCSECGAKIVEKKKFCPNCGAEVKKGSKFCSECGEKL